MGRPREVSDEQILAAARSCFLERGPGVTAAEIAKELGVSHTTLFHRFGSKEGLMMAALGPPDENASWIRSLEEGPDERPIREQLVAHARVMSAFYQDLSARLGVLQAAGIDPARAHRPKKGVSAPQRVYAALVGWLERAQQRGLLGRFDADTLASTLLGALSGRAFTARICQVPAHHGGGAPRKGDKDHVERLVELLWDGIRAGHR